MATVLAGAALLAAACGTAATVVTTQLLGTGTEHASLRVVLTGGGGSTFTGTFAGHSLAGKWSPPDVAATKTMCPAAEPEELGMGGTYSGTFNGTSYVFHACDTTTTGFDFKINGTVGNTAISGEAKFPGLSTSSARFSGSVGSQTIAGTATLTPQGPNGSVLVIAATMTIG